MSKGWTKERRAAQAERCRKNKPWEQSTGPKTRGGKARSSVNAYKHGLRAETLQTIDAMCLHHKLFLEAFIFMEEIEVKEHDEKQRLIRKHTKNLRTN